MTAMRDADWTNDDTMSEAEIRRHLTAEGWERVEALTGPTPSSVETRRVHGELTGVWSHSEQVDDERVCLPA